MSSERSSEKRRSGEAEKQADIGSFGTPQAFIACIIRCVLRTYKDKGYRQEEVVQEVLLLLLVA